MALATGRLGLSGRSPATARVATERTTPPSTRLRHQGAKMGPFEITSGPGSTPQPPARNTSTSWIPTRHWQQAHPRIISTMQSALVAFFRHALPLPPSHPAPPTPEPTEEGRGTNGSSTGWLRRGWGGVVSSLPPAPLLRLSCYPALRRTGRFILFTLRWAHGASSLPLPRTCSWISHDPVTLPPPNGPRHGGRSGCFDAGDWDGMRGGDTGRLVQQPSVEPRSTRCCAGIPFSLALPRDPCARRARMEPCFAHCDSSSCSRRLRGGASSLGLRPLP